MKRIVPLIFLVIFEAVADIFATKRSQNQVYRRWVGALLFYLICNTFRLFALKNWSGLGRWSVIFSVASAILAVFIWFFLFKEHFTTTQFIGLAAWVISIVLLSLNS